MKEIFDIKRFGIYFRYDIRNAGRRYGISTLILGLAPALLFVLCQAMSLITTGEWGHNMNFGVGILFVLCILVAVLTFPSKVYGHVTRRQEGSSWIALPASTLEKWLSIILISCIVLPFCLGVMFYGTDLILSTIFPIHYGNSLLENLGDLNVLSGMEDFPININLIALIYMNWCCNILTFTLGAIVFKKSKAAKTILCLMLLSILLSFIGVNSIISSENLAELIDFTAADATQLVNKINLYVNLSYTLVLAILLGSTFYRIKTIRN